MYDGLFASVMTGFTLNYTTPFALVLGASVFQIGLLSSLTQMFSAFVQLKTADIVEKVKGRVRFITVGVVIQATTWILISVIHFIFKKNPVNVFIILLTVNAVAVAFVVPAWYSLMSDTVDKNVYGKYFAWRSRIFGFINITSSLLAGLFIYFMSSDILLAFFIIFALAGICRYISAYFMGKMDDIPQEIVPEKEFSYLDFLRRFPKGNFIRFTIFVSGINFATFLAAPFFSVYMLKELNYSYATYTWIITLSNLAGLMALPLWGRLSDKIGNVKILQMSAVFLPVIPVLWGFSGNPFYIFFLNVFAMHVWNGFNLCVFNFIFDAASQPVRTRCIAYFSFTNGIAICLGALAGGLLLTHIPAFVGGSKFLSLFYISGLFRALINIFEINSFKEVRHSEKIEDSKLLLTVLGIAPVLELGDQILGRKLKEGQAK